uniref:Uncharacterized protein n=1 Tax=Phakopsora pachyrhizi TaxID=170000 RepID=A0A0S1MK71_PHAPC
MKSTQILNPFLVTQHTTIRCIQSIRRPPMKNFMSSM